MHSSRRKRFHASESSTECWLDRTRLAPKVTFTDLQTPLSSSAQSPCNASQCETNAAEIFLFLFPQNERVHVCCVVVIIFELQTFSCRGFTWQCGRTQYRAYIPPGLSVSCTQLRQSSPSPTFISSFMVSFFELPILSRRRTIPFLSIVQAPTNPPSPLSIVIIVKSHPLPTSCTRDCRTAIATAESTDLTVLPAAAAVLRLSGIASTSSALKVC